jgi:hypothetical protein
MSMPVPLRLILMRSPSAETEPCAQHEPQSAGVCVGGRAVSGVEQGRKGRGKEWHPCARFRWDGMIGRRGAGGRVRARTLRNVLVARVCAQVARLAGAAVRRAAPVEGVGQGLDAELAARALGEHLRALLPDVLPAGRGVLLRSEHLAARAHGRRELHLRRRGGGDEGKRCERSLRHWIRPDQDCALRVVRGGKGSKLNPCVAGLPSSWSARSAHRHAAGQCSAASSICLARPASAATGRSRSHATHATCPGLRVPLASWPMPLQLVGLISSSSDSGGQCHLIYMLSVC